MENKKALVWLRDDFRINRNNALVYASENHEQVSTIYIFNPEEYENKREAQRWWIYHSLINFKQELSKFNISLELLVGDEIKVLNKIKKNEEISLYWNKIPEPEEEKKEKKIIKNLEDKNINYKFFKGNVLSEYKEVTCKKIMKHDQYLILLETGDEVLNYKDAVQFYNGASIIIVQGGEHRFVSYEKYLPKIYDFLFS